MEIVIAGGGKIGETLCQELSKENIDITLIEQNQDRLEDIINKNDIKGIVGDAADLDNLVESRVGSCDMFIAVTAEDETNIISAIIAKEMGVERTVARVRNPKYTRHLDFIRDSLGITLIINPEQEAANQISRIIQFPESLSVEPFENGRVNIVEVAVREDSVLVDKSLNQFRQEYGDVLICAVTHEQDTFIPKGDTVLKEGDRLYVTGAQKDLRYFYRKAGYTHSKINSIMILGGGRLTYYLLKILDHSNLDILVIERDRERAVELSAAFPNAIIIMGNASDQGFLEEQRISQFDLVISLLGIDEENIINSLYALTVDVPKIITKVSRTELIKILGNTELQSVITPKLIIASEIIRFVRSLSSTLVSNVEALYRIADNKVEALQFLVKENSQAVGIKLKELNTKENTLIAYIIRNNELIFPTGEDSIETGDHVIIVTTQTQFDDIDDILAE